MKQNTMLKAMPLAFAAMMTLTGCGADSAATMFDATMKNDCAPAAEYSMGADECYEAEAGSWDVPDFNTEEYSAITENSFQSVTANPLSTFSADVDTASADSSATAAASRRMPSASRK